MGSEMGEGFDVAVVGASSAAGAGVRPVGDTEASDALMSTVPALSLRMNHRRQSRAARRMQLAHVSVYVAVSNRSQRPLLGLAKSPARWHH